MKNLIEQTSWQALERHYQDISATHMRDSFAADQSRFQRFSIKHGEILFDYSRNRMTDETMRLLFNLAEDINIKEKISDLFAGHPVNATENRPALHTALRDSGSLPIVIHNENISQNIAAARLKLFNFVDEIHSGKRRSSTGKAFQHIVNIGIGGSFLGPKMCINALQDFAVSSLKFHFISTIDPDHLRDVLEQIDPETTLFIVSSKSFSTIETMTNSMEIWSWLTEKLGADALRKHTVAVTANRERAIKFGIDDECIFTFWDWVGGRYSIWSAIGLPLVLMIGTAQFNEFLAGAKDIDQHFQTAPLHKNIPVIMALLAIWYTNFFHTSAQAIIPYSHRLRYLISYIQQMEMESNGKSVAVNGERINYTTGSVIFGEEGCNGQHSFHQLLHQGRHLIPVDFILIAKPHIAASQSQHDLLLASALSQAHALVNGRTASEAQLELKHSPLNSGDESLNQHLVIDGNKPSNILLLDRLTPKNLGALLAIYEHKIFVQGVIWNINSFDQWGVELGKKTLPLILKQMENALDGSFLDSSTITLIDHCRKLKDTP